ncbi:DUF1837 domain-containing protein [Photobacterium frigidiphilum]|uniref:HamA C-terminal domain-containing protein n=1 Tax=Photobacterium frigidiphilum TaxID=264736 RepID=UPI003D09777C
MDSSLKMRIKNQIFKFEATINKSGTKDSSFTLDYESGRYRQRELVGLIRDVVPFFALTENEIKSIDQSEWNRQSFTRISDANKNSKGDYGELLLFVILGIFYDVPKFVTKARLRSTTREQIKGFDCAHFSIENDLVTLWLGEAKFHKNISGAISSAFSSLNDHLNDAERIKSELRLLGGEIEINKSIDQDKYDLLKSYVSGGKSLNKVDISVPVLVTYDSKCIKNHCGNYDSDIESDEFKNELQQELESCFSKVYNKSWPSIKNIKIIFFIVPLESVSELKSSIDSVEMAMKF